MTDTTTQRVELILAAGAVAAYLSPLLDPPERPCSICETPSPAAEPGECYWPDTCPLEGAPHASV